MEQAKREVHTLLESINLNEYLLTKPPCGVFTISSNTTLALALHRLAAANVISAPLISDKNEYCGFIEVLDILSAIFEGGKWTTGVSAAEQLPVISAFLQETTVAEIPRSNDAEVLYLSQGKVTLLEVVKKGFVLPAFKLWCHRLAIVDASAALGNTNGNTGKKEFEILSIFSQSDALRFIYTHRNQVPTLMSTPITQFNLGRKPVFSVPHDMPAALAFQSMLLTSGVTAAAVLRNGKLVGNLSPTDLRGIAPEELGQLDLSVVGFLATRNHLGESVHIPGSLASIYGVKPPHRVGSGKQTENHLAVCSIDATMGQVISLLVERGVHRVYVTEDKIGGGDGGGGGGEGGVGGLCGVISLSDILNAVIGPI